MSRRILLAAAMIAFLVALIAFIVPKPAAPQPPVTVQIQAVAPKAVPEDAALVWLRDYQSDDNVRREQAISQAHNPELWSKLVLLGRDSNSDNGLRARSALAALSRPALTALLQQAKENLASVEEESAESNKSYRRKRDQTGVETVKMLNRKFETEMARLRLERSLFQSQVAQLDERLNNPGYLPVPPPIAWDPAILSFEERLQLPVSFEAVDLSLPQLLDHMKALTGIDMELKDPQSSAIKINLRVTTMSASLATEWFSRLADLHVTTTDQKLLIGKERPADVPKAVDSSKKQTALPPPPEF